MQAQVSALRGGGVWDLCVGVGERVREGEAVLLIAFQGFLHALFFVFHHL